MSQEKIEKNVKIFRALNQGCK